MGELLALNMRATRLIVLLALSCAVFSVQAETKWDHITHRNELRIGWGDQLFETLMWHNPTSIVKSMPTTYSQTYHEDYRYFQHLWIEYQWRFTHWFSMGAMADGSAVKWDDVTRNGQGVEIGRDPGHYFYNIIVMPTIRFTYFHHPNVNLYSGLGIGVDINSGTETNTKGQYTDFGAAVDVTVFGVSANYDRWFMTVDFGGMTAFKNSQAIYLAASRMINVSIGARF